MNKIFFKSESDVFFFSYHSILRTVEQDKSLNQNGDQIKHSISDANAIQTMNATFQYCPQFLFQSFLIVYRKYKCILTGMFSFFWNNQQIILIYLWFVCRSISRTGWIFFYLARVYPFLLFDQTLPQSRPLRTFSQRKPSTAAQSNILNYGTSSPINRYTAHYWQSIHFF